MNDLLRVIYAHLLDHLNLSDPEYRENMRCAALQYDKLLQTLTPEQAAHLRDYWDMSATAGALEQEALFLAAFRAGLRLGTAGDW